MGVKSTWWGVLRAGWCGLTEPTAGVLAGAVLVAIAWTVLAAVTLARTAPDSPALMMSSAHDGTGWIVAQLMNLRAEDDERTVVALLGASGVMDALASERELESALVKQGVSRAAVCDLTLQGANLEAVASLARVAADLGPTAVVLAVGPRAIAIDTPFGSTGGREVLRLDEPWGLTLSALVRVPLLVRNSLAGMPSPRRFYENGRLDPDELPNVMAASQRILSSYDEHRDANLRHLAGIITEVRAKQVRPILLQAPLSPAARDWIDSEVLDAFDADLAGIAEAIDVPLLRLDRAAELRSEDFFDPWHVGSPEARERYTRALAGRLAPLLVARDRIR